MYLPLFLMQPSVMQLAALGKQQCQKQLEALPCLQQKTEGRVELHHVIKRLLCCNSCLLEKNSSYAKANS